VANVAQPLRFDGELANRLISRAPRLLVYVLVVLLAFQVAVLLAQLAGPPAPAAITIAPLAPAVTRNVVDVPSILRANLFGQSAPAAGSTDAPVTSLSLQLSGVIAVTDPKRGFAIIGTLSGMAVTNARSYKVGDALPGGALLHAVYVDRVLLDRGGAIEALLMPVRLGATPATPPPGVAVNAAAQVQRVQQVMRTNPGIINQVLSRQPVMTNGKLSGMRVYPGSNSQAFNRLGLKAGDLVTAINGTLLEDRTRAEEVFNSLSGAAEAHITVMRNGTQQDLHLNLADIANEAERLAQQQAGEGAAAPAGPGSGPGLGPGPGSGLGEQSGVESAR
jgi:general secretion pathway protein C